MLGTHSATKLIGIPAKIGKIPIQSNPIRNKYQQTATALDAFTKNLKIGATQGIGGNQFHPPSPDMVTFGTGGKRPSSGNNDQRPHKRTGAQASSSGTGESRAITPPREPHLLRLAELMAFKDEESGQNLNTQEMTRALNTEFPDHPVSEDDVIKGIAAINAETLRTRAQIYGFGT